MKVILSRKGFDSSTGGCPSPIFPDGRLYSLPIYGIGSSKRYCEVSCPVGNLGSLVDGLDSSLARSDQPVHLDPDLDAASLPRLPGWRPAFGQSGTAQGHLVAQGVGIGDVFLFYGWFRPVERLGDRWRWARGGRDVHAIFGWLQVGDVLNVDALGAAEIARGRPWLRDHPHLHVPPHEAWGRNVIYVAAETLSLPGIVERQLPGGGVNRQIHDNSVLTAPAANTRSLWRLPEWFLGHDGRIRLSCNPNQDRWQRDGDHICLRSVRPQEQVIDCVEDPVAGAWVRSLIGH